VAETDAKNARSDTKNALFDTKNDDGGEGDVNWARLSWNYFDSLKGWISAFSSQG
jgi:hypothetical protein